jgi:hypothetical protein
MINKTPWLPRVSSDNIEEKCLSGSQKQYCAILAVDATGVGYTRINQTLDVFMRAKTLVEQHPKGKDVHFVWADKVAEHLNSTETWKSLTTVFSIDNADRKSENLLIVDNKAYNFKNFGGDLNKVSDFTDKDEDMKDFIVSMLDGKAGKTKPLPSPLFLPPPPPPYTQEDVTKLFVVALVCIAVLGALVWSYITFKKEETIKENIQAASGKKKKKEKRDGDYGVGDD